MEGHGPYKNFCTLEFFHQQQYYNLCNLSVCELFVVIFNFVTIFRSIKNVCGFLWFLIKKLTNQLIDLNKINFIYSSE